MATELTADSTHEDIQAAVDQIVEDRKGSEENALEEKGDAQAIAEDRDEPVTQEAAETDSGSDDTAHKGEDSGDSEESTAAKWLDDNLKAEIAAYGIGETELADFSSREELERALRLFDKTALEAGRKAMAEGDSQEEQPRDEQGRFQKDQPEPKEGQYEVTLDTDIYDEDLVGEFTRMRDHYESRISELETRFAQIDASAEEQRFDSLVDSLGHADLFGKSGKESEKELQRRQDLFVAVKAQQIGLEQLGRPTDLNESLINRVASMVFAAELSKKELKARTSKVYQQSKKKLGGSATKAHDSAEPLRDEMRRLYKELDEAG